MGDQVLRKVSHAGIGCSVVGLNDVRHVFAAAAPQHDGTFDQQAHDALATIEQVINEESVRGSIVHQAVFLADMADAPRCQQILCEFYGGEMPATSYISQPPCEGKRLAIEALGVGRGPEEVEIQRISPQLVVVRHHGITWVHSTQMGPQPADGDVYEASLRAFRQVQSLLGSVNVRFDQVIRTWLYLGGIVEPEGATQRYKELNRARTDFFRDLHFLSDRLSPEHGPIYPASTGIGTDGRGLLVSVIAFATERKDIRAVPLENPRQTAACDYAAVYSPQSPKFSRAMVLSCGTYATIFISGTASITESRTRHPGDVVAPDPSDARQHCGLDWRGECEPARLAGAGHLAGQPGAGAGVHQATGGFRRRARRVPATPGRTAHDLRRGRRLPARPVGGNRRRGVFRVVAAVVRS